MVVADSGRIIVEVGQRIYCALRHAGMGTVYGITGTQSPGTVETFLGGVAVRGGNARFAVVFDNGCRTEIHEAIARGIQWTIYAEKVDADAIVAALAFADQVKADKAAAKKAEDDAHADAVDALRSSPAFAQLTQDEDGSGKTAAANIRKELKAAFPTVKFSVRKLHYGNVGVSWTDGPTAATVEAITDRYLAGHFDGSDDSYKYDRSPWTDVFGCAQYISTRRIESPVLIERAIEAVFVEYADDLVNVERPTAEEYRFGHVYLVQVPGINESLADLIRRAVRWLEG